MVSEMDHEEVTLTAHEEARLLREGKKNVNQELVLAMSERTVESIKGQRRQQEYKNLGPHFLNFLGTTLEDFGRLLILATSLERKRILETSLEKSIKTLGRKHGKALTLT